MVLTALASGVRKPDACQPADSFFMDNLAPCHHTTVKITCTNGDSFFEPCEWNSADYGLVELGQDEESLQIGDTVLFADEILRVELLRSEVCIPVRDWPEAKEEIALWFHERWGIPLDTYRSSICACLSNETSVPQWYVVVRRNTIIAGCGVIENDFHERKDLSPNVCAVFVDKGYRRQGVAGFLLQSVCADMASLGFPTLYLLTDHTSFYERYGWHFHSMVRASDGTFSRMYVHHA